MSREIREDGTVFYTTNLEGYVCSLSADLKGRPIDYSTNRVDLVLAKNEIVGAIRIRNNPTKEIRFSPRTGALPDFNSRPDPYLTQHLLIQAYDLAKGDRQTLFVYDWDQSWTGFQQYDISLELADEDGVVLPNGMFKAKHFVQVQDSGQGTGFKKWPGSRTDIWVDDDLVILRIFRHREPYEVILQDYNNPKSLISADLKAQGLTLETTTSRVIQERLRKMNARPPGEGAKPAPQRPPQGK